MNRETKRQRNERVRWLLRYLGDIQSDIHALAALGAAKRVESVRQTSRSILLTPAESADRPSRRDNAPRGRVSITAAFTVNESKRRSTVVEPRSVAVELADRRGRARLPSTSFKRG
jgi:hypothetical protein